MNALDHATSESVPEDGRELLALRREIERPEIQALDAGVPGDLGEPDEERMAALHVLRAERRHEHDPTLRQVPRQEPQEIAGGRIAPVKVLQDEDERPIA